MPQLGLEVLEGTVAAIHVGVGTVVSAGDRLVEVETDKALSDVVAPSAGLVRAIEVDVGDTVAIGRTLLVLEANVSDEAPGPTRDPLPTATVAAMGAAATSAREDGPISPPRRGERLEPLSATRRAIARRVTLSQRIPQFSLTREIEVAWLLAQKAVIASDSPEVSVNDLLVQAIAVVAERHAAIAASYVDGEEGDVPQLCYREGVDVGVAVATDYGLVVPVIRRAHERSLAEIARERARLVGDARGRRLAVADAGNATLTLSSLASFGIDAFTAMVNPGETAIFAVGRVLDRVSAGGHGVVVVPTVTLTLTLDHRVADGASGAAALVDLAELLTGGMRWR